MKHKQLVAFISFIMLGNFAFGQSVLHVSSREMGLSASLLVPPGTYSMLVIPSFEPECCLSICDSCIVVISPDVNFGMFAYDKQQVRMGKRKESKYQNEIHVTEDSLKVDGNVTAELKRLFDAALQSSSDYEMIPFQDGATYEFFNAEGQSAYSWYVKPGAKDNCSRLAGLCMSIISAVKNKSTEGINDCIPTIKELANTFDNLSSNAAVKEY